MKFDKPACSHQDHIALLRDRGLHVPSEEKATRYLNNIGYYRLSAYFHPFFITKDIFKRGTYFDDILKIYIFDRQLRLLSMDAVERIEVSIRTSISNEMSQKHGPHWFLDTALFMDKAKHDNFIQRVEECVGKTSPNKRTQFCKHYYDKYCYPTLPPSWMVCEVLPMGTWSNLFQNISNKQLKRSIAGKFNFKHDDFSGWIHALTVIRNCIAHHSRFWNVTFPHRARNIKRYSYNSVDMGTPYTNFVLIAAFLKQITNKSTWPQRLMDLIAVCPLDIHRHMGFPQEWESIPFWQ